MYGELNFNPTLFMAQMKHIAVPIMCAVVIVLIIMYAIDFIRKPHKQKTEETETC